MEIIVKAIIFILYSFALCAAIPCTYASHDLPRDFSPEGYLEKNPDLKGYIAENNLDPQTFATYHYGTYGRREGRTYTPKKLWQLGEKPANPQEKELGSRLPHETHGQR
ncbi:MAG: hypothetical protein LW864_06695 [Alphaproteobacteria bacterium]|jgi:hypothetical protein|nr:hypothetical protein [Alphaproteobacteria bacterium]